MKAKELEVLAEAVRTENYRKYALENQTMCALQSFQNDRYSLNVIGSTRAALGSVNTELEAFVENNTAGIDWERVAEKVRAFMSKVSLE